MSINILEKVEALAYERNEIILYVDHFFVNNKNRKFLRILPMNGMNPYWCREDNYINHKGSRYRGVPIKTPNVLVPFLNIRNIFGREGFTLNITEEDFNTINANTVTQLPVICPNEHEITKNYKHFTYSSSRCPICSITSNYTGFKSMRKTISRPWAIKNMMDDPLYEEYKLDSGLIYDKKYQIDHILPIDAFHIFYKKNNFDYLHSEMTRIANIRENLQILTIEDNKRKSAKYNLDEFLLYMEIYYKKNAIPTEEDRIYGSIQF